MVKEAIEELEAELRLGDDTELAQAVRETYEKSGYAAALRTLYLTRLEQYRKAGHEIYISPLIIADLYSLLDEKDEAFNWLERAYEERSSITDSRFVKK